MRAVGRASCCLGSSLATSTTTLAVPSSEVGVRLASHTQRRNQTRVPNKGYREQPTVPDRLKDAMSNFGADTQNISFDKDPAFVPEQNRQHLVQDVMSSTQNMKSMSKMDRLCVALDKVRNEPPADEKWNEVYLFLRTTEMCTEVVASPTDEFPKGTKLWIELELCEEKRVPVLMTLPNGMPVLPIFTMEEYMDAYFSRTSVYESCWFPVPRNGTQWEEFCRLPFPACVTGNIQHFSTLATVALGGRQLGILVNPGKRASKFLTYPEMVALTQLRQQKSKDRRVLLSPLPAGESAGVGSEKEAPLFDETFMRTFDTSRMALTRLEPHELDGCLAERPPLPPVAQLELHLLLYIYSEIESVYVRTVDRPRWRRMLGASDKMTQIDVVCSSGSKPDKAFFTHLQRWSFMREFNSDVHVELTDRAPSRENSSGSFMCVYTKATDGQLLHSLSTFKGRTLADQLGYNEPLTDSKGNTPYEHFVSYF